MLKHALFAIAAIIAAAIPSASHQASAKSIAVIHTLSSSGTPESLKDVAMAPNEPSIKNRVDKLFGTDLRLRVAAD